MTNAEVKREQESERIVALPRALNSRSKLAESLTAVCAAKHRLSREKSVRVEAPLRAPKKLNLKKFFFFDRLGERRK